MRKILLSAILSIVCSTHLLAQNNQIFCANEKFNFPSSDALSVTPRFQDSPDNTILLDNNAVIIIPVVFHVLHHPNVPAQYISASVIQQQLARINTDFRMQNQDVNNVPSLPPYNWLALAANLNFEFQLACIDPQGNTTTGIIYKELPQNQGEFCPDPNNNCWYEPMLDIFNGSNAWPTDTYLNIWICDFGADGVGMLPEMRFWAPVMIGGVPYSRTLFDGVVLDYMVVGDPGLHSTRNMGRTLVHEIGHWLGLRHLWGDQLTACVPPGDFVADTPPQEHANNTCETHPYADGCSQAVMFMNYMDYTYDGCKYFFTAGQRARTRSFFLPSPPNDPATRYPFIQNYFSIKCPTANPVQAVNNIITVYMQNPACLPVYYTVTGTVTVTRPNNQSIRLVVPCGTSGQVTITARSGFSFDDGNYFDQCTFNFVNPIGCVVWPKSYQAENIHRLIRQDNSGNIFTALYGDLSTNVNHYGALPSQTGYYTLQYSKQTGYTNWFKQDLVPHFATSAGALQMKTWYPPITTSFYDVGTGAPVSGPPSVPADHIILAQINSTDFITAYGTNLYVCTQFSLPSPTPFINSAEKIEKTFFNPSSGKLFVEYSSWFGIRAIVPYQLSNNTLNELPNPGMPAIDNGQYLILVNSNDIVYTNSPSAQQLFKYDYSAPIPTFSPITIAGFPNTSIFHWGTPKETCRNVSDNILAINLNENKIYSVNTVTSQVKNIEYSSSPPLQGLEFPEYDYVYDGNFIYLTGNIEGQPSSGNLLIGNPPVQSIYYYPTQTTILTKLSLDDFSFRVQSGGEDVLTKTSKSTNFVERPDGIRIFPNPSTTQLTISSSTTTISRVTIYNIYGSKVTERTFNNSNIVALTLAELNQGVYTCRMLTSGGIVNKKIVVLR